MKKLFNKFLAGAISLALIATLAFGISYSGNVKAANELTLGNWSFVQGGIFQGKDHAYETAWGNVYFFNKVTMQGTNEVLDQWDHPSYEELQDEPIAPQPSTNQTFTATQASNGFVMDIDRSGWDCTWGPEGANQNFCNPWGFTGTTHATISPDHRYKVTFKVKAEGTKYGYIDFSTSVDGHNMTPWDGESGNPMCPDVDNPKQYFEANGTEKTISYTFLNAVGGVDLSAEFRFGTFLVNKNGKAYGYGGLDDDISDIVKASDDGYSGDITVSDFTIEDLDPDLPTVAPKPTDPTDPPEESTTVAPTTQPQTQVTTAPETQAPTVKPGPAPTPTVKTLDKVTGVKVKNTKKKTIKVTWKKVANAKSYQIKVGKKTYKATKNSKKIKNKKFKKGKKVKVKVRAIAAGYKAGAWSKTVKKKLKK